MGRRIVGIVVLLALLIGGFLLWRRHNDAQALASGDVHCNGCMTPEEQVRFAKDNAGETADGVIDRKNKTAQPEAATDLQDAAPSNGSVRGSGQRAAGTTANSSAGSTAERQTQPSSLPLTSSSVQPAPDTLPTNAQNGARFAGSGPYQWYRQGNLTWRIDTVSGRSCIIYATLEEWRKPIVMSHGCGRNA